MSLAVEARSLNHWTMREVPIARMIYLKWVFSSSQGPHEVDVTTVLFVQMEKGDQVKYLDKVIQWVGSGAGAERRAWRVHKAKEEAGEKAGGW